MFAHFFLEGWHSVLVNSCIVKRTICFMVCSACLRVAEGCVNEHYRAKSKCGWCCRDTRDCWHTVFCWLLCRCHVAFNLWIYLHVLLIIIPVLFLAQLVALLIVGICRSTVICLGCDGVELLSEEKGSACSVYFSLVFLFPVLRSF